MKITRNELKGLILQEVRRLEKIDELEGKLKLINEALEHPENINEEELDEFFKQAWQGVKSAYQQGQQQAALKSQDKQTALKDKQQFKAQQKAAKQQFKTDQQATKVQNQRQNKIALLKTQIDNLMKQYKDLSGGQVYKGGAVHKAAPVMAEGEKWMQKAFAHKEGSLHKTLGVSTDEKISDSKMSAGYGKSDATDKKIRAAVNANPEEYPKTKAKIKAQSEKNKK